MTNYTYEEYLIDILAIEDRLLTLISRGHKIHLIGIYRGSLPMAVHLSNILPAEMSIIKFQSRDGDDKVPEWVLDNTKAGDTLIILDDIYDSGKTMKVVNSFLKEEKPDSYIESHVLIGSKQAEADDVFYYTEHNKDWIVFPWELDYVGEVNESVA